jgi:hypothetical protein
VLAFRDGRSENLAKHCTQLPPKINMTAL